ncbi:Lrp/AsnC family transcriptional regulator [Cupriavidus sp. 30B13]|uniref:Lrp/AsnC family transcriptional regulator n=1 Tax=Cupriavidus sp. 30B13 TaxID=3384241 RepID=UPI003B90195F
MQRKNSYSAKPGPAGGSEERRLDAADRRILAALRRNGRLTIAELAEEVGLSASPCWNRLKRLEAAGAIDGYVAVLNARYVGIPQVFYIEITLDHPDEKSLERFGVALAEMPEVMEAHLVTGEYDYLVKVAVIDADHYEGFLRRTLYRIKGIRSTRSTFALRTLKFQPSVDPMLVTDRGR